MNIVTWLPGRVGKGWVFPDGTVRAWNVNHREQPNHADVEHPEGSVRFRIDPAGLVEVFSEVSWHREVANQAIQQVRDQPTEIEPE